MTTIKIHTENPESATIILQILQEVERAEAKHPVWPDDVIYMDSIVNEEKGEVSRACVQYAMEGGPKQAISEELIQTAATCIRMLKSLQNAPDKK